ncbi:MAG: cytochrome c [Burkholderiales bacterium]|nr:cytochrome c [Burkholderiales bacterium]
MHRLTLAASFAVLSPSAVAGDPEAGRGNSSAACSIRHGADGKAMVPMYLKLAGQNRQYLVYAMKAYKSGERKGSMSGIMVANVANLSDQDLDDLAAFYAGLPP